MAAYLIEHPPDISQFHCPRREAESGVIVVHTAENTPDFVAFDGGAEAVANFIQHRDTYGSYHDLVDSDSIINLVPYECEAFHDATDHGNWHEYGVSAATRADVWPLAPDAWRAGCVLNMAIAAARYATWLRTRRGIVIPARRITRDQSEDRIPGFISHAERDPARRTDPGAHFPWDEFLDHYTRLTEDDDMPYTESEMINFAAKGFQKAIVKGGPSVQSFQERVEEGVEEGLAIVNGVPGKAVDQMHARVRDGVKLALDDPEVQQKLKDILGIV